VRRKETAQTVTLTSPAAASTTAVGATIFAGSMFQRADRLVVDATLLGGTGGTLDVYLQRKIAADTWRDWIHFPQVAAATAKKYTVTITGDGTSIVETGGGSDAAPGVALAANTAVNVIPGGDVRVVFVSGGGVSVGASNSITITPYVEVT
jgi:hypothetical protein